MQDPEHYVIRLIVHVAQMVQEFAYAIVGRIAIRSPRDASGELDFDFSQAHASLPFDEISISTS